MAPRIVRAGTRAQYGEQDGFSPKVDKRSGESDGNVSGLAQKARAERKVTSSDNQATYSRTSVKRATRGTTGSK